MRIIILAELEFGKADKFRSYLANKNFFANGREFVWRTAVSEAGKFLFLPENIACIKELSFGNDEYYVELPVVHEWLKEVAYTPEEGEPVLKGIGSKKSLNGFGVGLPCSKLGR